MRREELLERQLERERRAREEAERLLEDKSNELYAARLRAEAAEGHLSDALRSLDDGLLLFDQDGKLILANRRFFEIYPQARSICKPGIAEGKLWRELIGQGAFSFGSRRLFALPGFGGENQQVNRWERVTAQGAHICIIEQETEAGQRISLHRDITEMRTAETQLQWRLAAIEEAADGIAITDQDGHYLYLNMAHARLLSYESAASLIGRSWRRLYDEEELERFEREIIPELFSQGSWQGTVEARDALRRRRVLELSMSLLPTRGILSVLRDITERREAEAQQQRVMQRLYEAERMEAVGQLARVVAHDFNNVLLAISAFADNLQSDFSQPVGAQRLLGKINSAISHAEEVVNRLQASVTDRPLERGRVDLVALARDTADMVRATLGEQQELRLRTSDSALPVLGDHAQLGQTVMNFLVNAREALGEAGGSIVVTVAQNDDPRLRSEGWAFVSQQGACPKAGPVICLSVEDSGCGMDGTVIERAFEPDFSTKSGKAVRGLGLSTSGAVADAHEGAIVLESTPGFGSRATLCLPRYRLRLPSCARVLVIDDDPLAGAALSGLLVQLGHRADFLDHPLEAWGVLEDDPNTWDLVITDQQMPQLDGLSLARRLLDLRPSLPVIICTGMPGWPGNAPANVANLISKPVRRRVLQEALAG
ncbi:MAG: PAS-domain containing protein [Pseudomonadota bacterium]